MLFVTATGEEEQTRHQLRRLQCFVLAVLWSASCSPPSPLLDHLQKLRVANGKKSCCTLPSREKEGGEVVKRNSHCSHCAWVARWVLPQVLIHWVTETTCASEQDLVNNSPSSPHTWLCVWSEHRLKKPGLGKLPLEVTSSRGRNVEHKTNVNGEIL